MGVRVVSCICIALGKLKLRGAAEYLAYQTVAVDLLYYLRASIILMYLSCMGTGVRRINR